jgi:MFS family permease
MLNYIALRSKFMSLRVRWELIILIAGFFTVFISYGVRFGYGVILPEMIKSLCLTRTDAGIIASMYFVTYTIFAPITGVLVDKFGGRKTITLFCIPLGGGTFLMGISGDIFTAGLFYAVVGIGAAGCWVPVVTTASKWFNERRKGTALGILTMGYSWGYGVLGLVLPVIIAGYGWRACWYTLGIIGLMMAVVNWFSIRDSTKFDENKVKIGKKTQELGRKIFRSNKFWIVGISYFAITVTVYIVMTFLVTFLTKEHGIDYGFAGMLISIIAFSGIAGGLTLSAVSDYVGRRNILVFCNSLMAICTLSFVIVGSNLLLLILVAVGYGFAFGGMPPAYAACSSDYFPREVTGTVIGLWTICLGIAAIISPILGGYVADMMGSFFWSFIIGFIVAVVGALTIFMLQKENSGGEGVI